MTVKIKSLQTKNLGPLESLQVSLGQVNLFYGLNESGKTYLVEFLLQSLFRQSKSWGLRENAGKGFIEVQGIASEPIKFRPDGSQKLEHFWDKDGIGLPLNMARLLVVKGGELSLSAGSPGGVDRETLNTALTSQALLNQIWDSIPSTVRDASVEDGQILGYQRGLIKKHTEALAEIQALKKLLEQIENHYSRGPAREIEKKLEIAQNASRNQQKAKRHLAYQTWKKLDDLNRQRKSYQKDDLFNLRDAIKELENIDKDISALEAKLSEDNERSKEYPWLEIALALWEEKGLDNKKAPPKYLGIAGLIGIGTGAALLILENILSIPELIWLGSGIFGIGFGLALYYVIQLLNWSGQIDDSRERKSIQADYEKKFGIPLNGLAELKTQKTNLQEIYISTQTTQSLLSGKENQRKLKAQSIENSFSSLADKTVPEQDWQEELSVLTNKSESLDNQILETTLQLTKLDVSEDIYSEEPAESGYDPGLIQSLDREIEDLESDLVGQQGDLENLKARACERTGDDIKEPWKEILYHLQSLLDKKIDDFKDMTASLIAGIGLAEVLKRLREEEDQKIVQALNTEAISNILYKITGRYQKLDLVDDQLYVQDAFSIYPLSDLSTGAREQVQLALRMGIAAQICEGDPLFLILDDAFQHSDWSRRETLVRSTLELARSGWQILYLTMDDHIRDLFLAEVKPTLKRDFKLIQLG